MTECRNSDLRNYCAALCTLADLCTCCCTSGLLSDSVRTVESMRLLRNSFSLADMSASLALILLCAGSCAGRILYNYPLVIVTKSSDSYLGNYRAADCTLADLFAGCCTGRLLGCCVRAVELVTCCRNSTVLNSAAACTLACLSACCCTSRLLGSCPSAPAVTECRNSDLRNYCAALCTLAYLFTGCCTSRVLSCCIGAVEAVTCCRDRS